MKRNYKCQPEKLIVAQEVTYADFMEPSGLFLGPWEPTIKPCSETLESISQSPSLLF